MHAVVVETDPDTAEIKILRYCVVHDCGTLINPMIVEGQIHGGVAQGVGGALYERMEYAADGQLLNASFMDFLMPYASEVPEHRDRPPRHAVAAEPARRQGRGGGRRDPRLGRDRRRHRGRRGHHDHPDADLARASCSTSAQPSGQEHRMKIIGNAQFVGRARRSVWQALNDPAVLVRSIPGCHRLEALGDDAYAMTVAAGVGSIKGVYDGTGAAHRPGAPRLVPDARPGRRRRGHDRRRRARHARGGGRAAPRSPTTRTPSSAG